ncbi:TetR/AcrR family transcriptional regulator [Thermodesulfobacteriota bacterium]
MSGLRANKRQDILQAAILLFAEQGFDGTTTLQISKEAGITEPVIYYHFTGKDALFTGIIASTFEKFFAHLNDLPEKTDTAFEKIENLIVLHFDIVKEMPDEIYLAVSTCPARLKDPDGICRKSIRELRRRLKNYLSGCLAAGMATGEFHPVPVEATANLIVAMLNGLLRQRGLGFEEVRGLKETTAEFCRRSLVKTGFKHR